jgi:hypothetical protein
MNDLIRQSYDRLAAKYADALWTELDGKPLDRWLLQRFAGLAAGPILDVGCGPGHIAAFLGAQGISVTGLDLSPEMVALARERVPEARFVVGDLHHLPDVPEPWAGVLSMYSLVHVPRGSLGPPVRELARALRHGGVLLVALHAGDTKLTPGSLWDVTVDLTWHFHPIDDVLAAIREADLEVVEAFLRWPYPTEHPSQRLYVLARRGSGAPK